MRVNLANKKLLRFLTSGRPKLLRLAVIQPKENKPHVSSVWYLFSDGSFWISTASDRLKVRAIRKNPKVALIIDTDVMPYEGIIVEGRAKLTKTDLERITLAIVRKYIDRKNVEKQFRSLMRSPRILIRVEPLKALDIMSYQEH